MLEARSLRAKDLNRGARSRPRRVACPDGHPSAKGAGKNRPAKGVVKSLILLQFDSCTRSFFGLKSVSSPFFRSP